MIRKIITVILCAVILLATLLFILFVVSSASKSINKNKIQQVTSGGINEECYIKLGRIEQYIQIRGQSKSNPIIVFLHGGPGNPNSNLSYYFQPYLVSDYTFVDWDQRGCGKSHMKNSSLNVDTELSTEILLADLDELVDYLRDKFEQDKVIIMGHSCGTLLGSKYALDNHEMQPLRR
ncbi:MAG: alpha/beta fold hydrolase [Oscillospiraceae bacterium]